MSGKKRFSDEMKWKRNTHTFDPGVIILGWDLRAAVEDLLQNTDWKKRQNLMRARRGDKK